MNRIEQAVQSLRKGNLDIRVQRDETNYTLTFSRTAKVEYATGEHEFTVEARFTWPVERVDELFCRID